MLFSSDAHLPGKNGLQKYPPAIPDDIEQLAKPAADDPVDVFGRGFLRYANAKLAIVMWMYALNWALEKVLYMLQSSSSSTIAIPGCSEYYICTKKG